MGYDIGLVSISFRNIEVEDIIKAVAETGLKCIEWGSDVHAPFNDTDKLMEIAKKQELYGIYCSSYGTYFKIGENDSSEITEYINAAVILGTKVLRIWCGNKDFKEYSLEELSSILKECKKISTIAEERNIVICVECHNNTITSCAEGMLWLMESVGSPNFLMYWQPNQFISYDANIDFAIKTSPYSKHIHVFNWKGNLRFSLQESIEEWKKYLSCFEENKTLLLEFMPDNDIKSLPNEVEALKKIIGDM